MEPLGLQTGCSFSWLLLLPTLNLPPPPAALGLPVFIPKKSLLSGDHSCCPIDLCHSTLLTSYKALATLTIKDFFLVRGLQGRGTGTYCLMGAEFQLCEMRRVLQMGSGTRAQQCAQTPCHQNAYFKMVWVVNFILHVFHSSSKHGLNFVQYHFLFFPLVYIAPVWGSIFFKHFILYQNIADLKCCVGFRCTAK